MKKNIILIILLLILLPVLVNAESVQTGKFKYMPAFEDETEEVYYYSDDYFKETGKEYNEHLLEMSYNLSLSTFEIRDCSYSKDLLEEIGYKNFKAYDMKEKPTLDTIGMVIATKKVGKNNIVAVAIRGEKYDSEWGNNFIVGKSGDAKGFSDSSVKVINRIKKYISDNNLDNVKLWITGYSRAGTIADLTGVYINNHLNEFKTTADDLYIYTFEPPAASIDDTVYDNIYTVINKNDLIPQVYPKTWGFYTNGKIISIGDNQTITTYKGLLSQEEIGSVDTNAFLNDFFTWLPSRLSRDEYATDLEQPVSKIMDIYFSKNEEDRAKLMAFLTNEVKTEVIDTCSTVFLDIFERNSDSIYKNLSKEVIKAIENVENSENAKVLTADELQTIKNSIYYILKALGPIIVDDYYYFDGIDYDTYYAKYYPQFVLDENEYAYINGKEKGFSRGYSDAQYDNPRDNTVPDWMFQEDDTEKNIANFTRGYQEKYDDGYDLGLSHKNDIEAKGKYDGIEAGKEIGSRAGANGKPNSPNPDDYYTVPNWIGTWTECDDEDEYCESTIEYSEVDLENIEKYKTNYYEGFIEGWNEGYSEGQNDGPNRGMELSMYHFATLLKNVSTLMTNHYPQNNLKLIHALDSYYAPYALIEGENQTIDNSDKKEDTLTFKTSGHLEKLIKVQVDGKDLEKNDYELKSGSTIVTLKNSFLETLKEGIHTLKLIYIDNTIETTFKIENNKPTYNSNKQLNVTEITPPKTNAKSISNIIKNNLTSKNNFIIYIILFVLSIVVTIKTTVYIKRIKN